MKQRQCVILVGERQWCEQSSKQLLTGFSDDRLICFSEQAFGGFPTLPSKQAITKLGHEFDAVIFDATTGLCPDSLGVSVGTIRAGGVLILCIAAEAETSLWAMRFKRILDQYIIKAESFYCVEQGTNLAAVSISVPNDVRLNRYQTADQQEAIKAIFKVVHGHRRRPLLLSADRGRGKSAALGIAAATLLREGKQKILVTAPSLATVDAVFKHAAMALPEAQQSRGLLQLSGAEIRFIAPDALLESSPQADLLLVDEAAAIPITMLEQMLKGYARLVFSTTLHGYEGTGRGFAVRFRQLLEQHAPEWRQYHLNKPIRWLEDDQLEAMSFDALLLNADPIEGHLIVDAGIEQCDIERLDRQHLLTDERMLRQLFGLMVLAHYRTRPSDLKMLLDRADMSIYVVRYHGHIVGTAWVVDEGKLPFALAQAVYRGERRLAGHLLPQSLLAHAGLESAGDLRYRRLVRIAIHPQLQRTGLATALITRIADECSQDKIDLLGTSFGADADLLAFWQQTAFQAVRLGVQRDDVSGRHALMMLRASSETGRQQLASLRQRFSQQWLTLLSTQFSDLDTSLVLAISQQIALKTMSLSDWDWQDVNSFANEARTYETCQIALIAFASTLLGQVHFSRLSGQQQQLVMMLLIQRQPLVKVVELTEYSGKKQVISALREAIATLLLMVEQA